VFLESPHGIYIRRFEEKKFEPATGTVYFILMTNDDTPSRKLAKGKRLEGSD
jgi:hypothetical protein